MSRWDVIWSMRHGSLMTPQGARRHFAPRKRPHRGSLGRTGRTRRATGGGQIPRGCARTDRRARARGTNRCGSFECAGRVHLPVLFGCVAAGRIFRRPHRIDQAAFAGLARRLRVADIRPNPDDSSECARIRLGADGRAGPVDLAHAAAAQDFAEARWVRRDRRNGLERWIDRGPGAIAVGFSTGGSGSRSRGRSGCFSPPEAR